MKKKEFVCLCVSMLSLGRIVSQKPSGDYAEQVNDKLSYEHGQLLIVPLRVAHLSVLVHRVRYADGEAHDEDDDEHDECDEQVAPNLGPNAQNSPHDDGDEEHAERHVCDVLPLEAHGEPAHRVTYDVVVKERADQRAMIDCQEDLKRRVLKHL